MKILFVHQNMPGQYKHLVQHFAKDPNNEVVFITNRKNIEMPNVKKIYYEMKRSSTKGIHRYVSPYENAVIYAQSVAQKAIQLDRQGWVPDVICVHPGWGEGLFLKDIFPNTPSYHFCEFYYQAFGADTFFKPEKEVSIDAICRIRAKNANLILNAQVMDWGISPTIWQWQQFPPEYRDKISVIHDGIDTNYCKPDENETYELPNGKVVSKEDEVITYVARNFEPYRGFETYMRALEIMCKRRPNAHFIAVGADGVSYGAKLAPGDTYRKRMMKEVDIDESRVHFVGRLPYDKFQKVFRVSSAHIYLTYPFVLSWSFLEAMSSGCVLVGSKTPPVQEVIEEGKNGFMVDFFDPKAVADKVDDIFAHKDRYRDVGIAARQTVKDRYDASKCLPQHIQIIEGLAKGVDRSTLPTNHPPKPFTAEWEKPENIKKYQK